MLISRRSALLAAGAGSAALAQKRILRRTDQSSPGGLCLNEDNSHYFYTRAGQKLDEAAVDSWVDQYAGAQIRELMLCPNAMRTSYASSVWDPIWRGYDPNGPDDQPLLASSSPEARQSARRWIHTAWELHQAGIDVYARWIRRARQLGLSPWLSVRMNDVHNVDDERSFLHSEFWRENPHLRRVPYRFAHWNDRAFDYGRAEVRAHHFRLIKELAERYDFDGLELDWMRFGYHFRPGHEAAGREILTEFTADVRRLLDGWQHRRGHRIRLGARVPTRPATALGLGFDPVTWARRNLVDLLVVTPFFSSSETDIPIELWKQLLDGSRVTLAAGLEILVRPYPDFQAPLRNSLLTARAAAASFLERGADRVYLFNFMDSDTAMDDLANYPTLLREAGSLGTLRGKPRRHVLTFADTWAPGEPRASALPVSCEPGRWYAFRLATGPQPAGGQAYVHLGLEGLDAEKIQLWEVRLNGELCPYQGPAQVGAPKPDVPLSRFGIPLPSLHRGYNLVELQAKHPARAVWVEIGLDL
jgi:hypothetical protein